MLDLYITGMHTPQIARVLGRDAKSTDNALSRIRSKLRKAIGDEGRERKGTKEHMIKLNFAGIHTRQELHRYLEEKLQQLPQSQGESLDNIYDFLTLAAGRLHIIVEGMSRNHSRLGGYLDGVVQDAARGGGCDGGADAGGTGADGCG